MTTQIRQKVFETNSSSSHSLSVFGEEAADFGLDTETLRSGIIRVDQREGFNWRWEQHHGTATKIAYMLIQCDPEGFSEGVEPGEDIIPSLTAKNENARWLVDVIERATGCKVEFTIADSWIGIDHQSHGEGGELFSNETEMRKFLFSSSSYLQTGNDNDDPYGY